MEGKGVEVSKIDINKNLYITFIKNLSLALLKKKSSQSYNTSIYDKRGLENVSMLKTSGLYTNPTTLVNPNLLGAPQDY